MVVFLNFHTEVEGQAKATKGKAKGGRTRVYHFEQSAAFTAKNRHNIPARMTGTGTPEGDFAEFCKLVKAGIKTN